jgi:hypothetical protein
MMKGASAAAPLLRVLTCSRGSIRTESHVRVTCTPGRTRGQLSPPFTRTYASSRGEDLDNVSGYDKKRMFSTLPLSFPLQASHAALSTILAISTSHSAHLIPCKLELFFYLYNFHSTSSVTYIFLKEEDNPKLDELIKQDEQEGTKG